MDILPEHTQELVDLQELNFITIRLYENTNNIQWMSMV